MKTAYVLISDFGYCRGVTYSTTKPYNIEDILITQNVKEAQIFEEKDEALKVRNILNDRMVEIEFTVAEYLLPDEDDQPPGQGYYRIEEL